MKKLNYLLICLIGIFLFGLNVDAASIEIASGTTNDDQVNVKLVGADVKNYKRLTINLTGYKFNCAQATGLDCQRDTQTALLVPKSSTFTDGMVIGTIDVNKYVTNNYNITLSYGFDDTDPDQFVATTGGAITYVAPKSKDATLTNLSVTQGSLVPAFDPGVTNYSVTVADTIESIGISATPAAGANITGAGNKTLSEGENKFEIVVTAEDGTNNKTYTVNVLRGQVEEPSAFLKSLKINNIGCVLSPKFKKDRLKYTVKVGEDIDSLDFDYEPEDAGATVTVDGNKDFEDGENEVTITVEASDKSDTQVYTINVKKNMTQSTKNKNDSKKKKSGVKWWVILIILIAVLGVVGVVLFILHKKGKFPPKKNKKNKDNQDRQDKSDNKEKKKSKKKSFLDKLLEDDDDDDDDDEDEKPKKKAESKEDEPKDEEPYKYNDDNDESITNILKGELYDETEKTTTFDTEKFKKAANLTDEEENEKTKEFDINDFK